jgi:hypothetical protein
MQEQELAARKTLDTSARLSLAETDIFILKGDVSDLKSIKQYVIGAVAGVSLCCALTGWYVVAQVGRMETTLQDVAAIKVLVQELKEQLTRLDNRTYKP